MTIRINLAPPIEKRGFSLSVPSVNLGWLFGILFALLLGGLGMWWWGLESDMTRLNREIAEYLRGPEIQQRLYSFGLATEGAGTPESTARFIRDDQARWRAPAKELDVQPQ